MTRKSNRVEVLQYLLREAVGIIAQEWGPPVEGDAYEDDSAWGWQLRVHAWLKERDNETEG